MGQPLSYGRGVPQAAKIDVFDDFRPYKLRAITALNNGVFKIEKSFVPLLVCTNLIGFLDRMNNHNGKYQTIKDLSIINLLINSNGGFNFSLFSFDISEFILSPGFYVKNIQPTYLPSLLQGFQYSKEIINPFGVPITYPRGQEPPEPVLVNVPETLIDVAVILIYLEV